MTLPQLWPIVAASCLPVFTATWLKPQSPLFCFSWLLTVNSSGLQSDPKVPIQWLPHSHKLSVLITDKANRVPILPVAWDDNVSVLHRGVGLASCTSWGMPQCVATLITWAMQLWWMYVIIRTCKCQTATKTYHNHCFAPSNGFLVFDVIRHPNSSIIVSLSLVSILVDSVWTWTCIHMYQYLCVIPRCLTTLYSTCPRQILLCALLSWINTILL